MNKYCKEINQSLNEEINELTTEIGNSLVLYEKIIDLIVKKIVQLKLSVLKHHFRDTQEEINFFKNSKPNVLSKLIYYNAIYKIEAKKPYGGEKVTEEYLNNELLKIKNFFDNNLEFYKYYRTNSTYLDDKYFVRGKHDIKLSLDTYYFESDHSFSTSHDYKVAKIIANDLIQVYLEDQLYNMNKHLLPKLSSTISVNWTASKTAMIEMLYALHYQGVFDNGNIDIRLIAKHFENTFNIDLGDFYHTYLELKNRKVNRTKFLDSLREGLTRKMDEQDEK
ncbi:RteC domain-containing protein [Flavobacterium magnesitis]|uniref:RteC domain-containing protein n=1 Tax=Flavobacterium magnesitis TaxID=3138077 RepID=UPI00358F55D3